MLLLNGLASKYGSSIPGYGAWKETLRYLPTFFAGALTARLQIPAFFRQLPKFVLPLCTIITLLLVISVAIVPILPFGNLYVNIPTYLLLICLYSLLSLYPIKSHWIVIDNLDKNSMGIYIIHHLLIWILIVYIPVISIFLATHPVTGPIILFLIIFTLSWLLAHLFTKTKFLRFLFNFRYLYERGRMEINNALDS